MDFFNKYLYEVDKRKTKEQIHDQEIKAQE